MSFFSFSLFSFFFYKIGEQEGRIGPTQWWSGGRLISVRGGGTCVRE
jgi:hypothetical protein